MPMKRSERLQRVAGHFGEDQDLASRKLAELRSMLDQAEERWRELGGYLDAYHSELEALGRSGASSAKLQNYRAFIAQLQEALGQQQKQVEQARSAFDRQKDVWYRARTQVRALEQAMERTVAIERKADDRAEQRQLDELSLHRFLDGRR